MSTAKPQPMRSRFLNACHAWSKQPCHPHLHGISPHTSNYLQPSTFSQNKPSPTSPGRGWADHRQTISCPESSVFPRELAQPSTTIADARLKGSSRRHPTFITICALAVRTAATRRNETVCRRDWALVCFKVQQIPRLSILRINHTNALKGDSNRRTYKSCQR